MALLDAENRRNRLVASVREAVERRQAAVAARDKIVQEAAQAGNVPAQASIAAQRAVADAEGHLTLLREGEDAATAAVETAQRALNEAGGASHRPVLEHAIDRRIAAVARIAAAELVLAEARAEYALAGDIAAQAQAFGARSAAVMPILGNGPYSNDPARFEEAERRAWGRPPSEPLAAE